MKVTRFNPRDIDLENTCSSKTYNFFFFWGTIRNTLDLLPEMWPEETSEWLLLWAMRNYTRISCITVKYYLSCVLQTHEVEKTDNVKSIKWQWCNWPTNIFIITICLGSQCISDHGFLSLSLCLLFIFSENFAKYGLEDMLVILWPVNEYCINGAYTDVIFLNL